MDEGGPHQNGRYKMDYYNLAHSPWNVMPQHKVKEHSNALFMNQKIMGILAERDAAILERNQALAEKTEALAQRDEAIQQREQAIAERDRALMERDNALSAIQYREEATKARASKRVAHPVYHSNDMTESLNTGDLYVTNAFPVTTVPADTARSHQIRRTKENKAVSMKGARSSRKVSRVGEDLNRQGATEGTKFRVDLDSQEVGLNLIDYDESTMPVPVCSCTGVPRQCYKWGSGGWQSSCCTTILSCYPLPQMVNKRHARVGGRKMSGSVFRKLLSRLAAQGHDVSIALDLKDYWARHGTNRYITIK